MKLGAEDDEERPSRGSSPDRVSVGSVLRRAMLTSARAELCCAWSYLVAEGGTEMGTCCSQGASASGTESGPGTQVQSAPMLSAHARALRDARS
eukprot:2011636-Rhodomonas_salina.5